VRLWRAENDCVAGVHCGIRLRMCLESRDNFALTWAKLGGEDASRFEAVFDILHKAL